MKKRHQDLWDAARAVLREKWIALNALQIKKKSQNQSSNLGNWKKKNKLSPKYEEKNIK